MNISKRYNIPIIEDNAHGLFGKYRGEYLELSVHFQHRVFGKKISHVVRWFLFLNDNTYIERRNNKRKGTNRSKFFRGQIDKYSWVDIHHHTFLREILAAFLLHN